ncbi:peptidoglycan-binding protein [Brachybacterium tyrofermentans]|uniref:peptidoglycan-binding protein n=1 Tax=Brachybacterium tyrofermentans TaxID=47848 RepID=UPI001868F16F|nr:peptidoglycan-binding protein [Brachybacterium tyrofermentans]
MSLLTLSRGDARLRDLPRSWSNQGRHEQLQREAAESLSHLVALAVAKSGSNFQLYDALRPIEEQIEMLQRNYRRVSRARYKDDDRSWDGSTWERRAGRPPTASPRWSKHGSGLAVDIHPGPIQDVFRREGRAWGWSWDEGQKLGEAWHFVFVGGNRYASRGWLDHAWVQEVVGAEVDGKIGVGTVKLIKAWQTEHGLEADGIVGPGTKAAMQGKGEAVVVTPPSAAKPAGDALGVAVDGVFPWADATTQAFDAKHPGQEYKGGAPKGLLHSTETGTWPGYGGGSSAPHMTVRFDLAGKSIEARQHFRIDRPSRALANKPGGVETNNWSVFQIEVIGSCDRAFASKHGYPFLPDLLQQAWARDALAAVVASVSASLDIPLASTVSWVAYPGSYGEQATQRLSGDDWTSYSGWLGHQHVPENDHGDPGDLPVAAILTAARGGAPAQIITPPSSAPAGLPSGKDALVALIAAPDFPLLRTPGAVCYYGPADGPIESVSGKSPNSLHPGEIVDDGAEGLRTWQAQMVERGYSLDVDGRYGDESAAAAENLQRLAGITQDQQIGPDTWYAAWLLPVK